MDQDAFYISTAALDLISQPGVHSKLLSHSTTHACYEMADPMGEPRFHVEAGNDLFDVRNHGRGVP